VIIDECLHAKKPTSLSPWIIRLVVFGREDPETGCAHESVFQAGFCHMQNLRAWAKVGAVPLTRACLQNSKVRCSIGDGTNDQQATALVIQEHNQMACAALTMAGYNGGVRMLTLKPAASTRVVTIAHSQDWIELSQAKTHGNIYAATGGDHLTSNDIIQGITQEAQSDVIDMAHMALGQMEALKKKELVLAAHAIFQEEFNQLVLARSEGRAVMTDEGFVASVSDGGSDDGLTDENPVISNVRVHSLDFGEDARAA
jgi:hypothetical protein